MSKGERVAEWIYPEGIYPKGVSLLELTGRLLRLRKMSDSEFDKLFNDEILITVTLKEFLDEVLKE